MASRMCGHLDFIICCIMITINGVWGLRTPLYSTYTGYEDYFEEVGGLPRELSWTKLAAELGEESETENCAPVNIYAVYRHASRYPDVGIATTFQSFFNRLKASSINPDYEYLKDEPEDRFTVDKALELDVAGFKEMNDIASRIKSRFPTLYENTPSLLRNSSFETTDANRARDSAEGFISGFVDGCTFGEANENVIQATCPTDDGNMTPATIFWASFIDNRLLLPSTNCDLYKENRALAEKDDEFLRFKNGPEVKQVQVNIQTRLKGEKAFNVTTDEIIALYRVCGMERALFENSNWCDLFSTSDLRMIEYLQDLNDYWYYGPGYEINYQPYCILLQNITSYLRIWVQEDSSTLKGLYKFGHSLETQGLLALMDLSTPSEIPTENNYPLDKDWDYAPSVMDPFSSSVTFTLFRCSDSKTTDEENFKVLVTHNEQPIKVGPCKTYFCEYTTLTSFLTSRIGTCDYDDMCEFTLLKLVKILIKKYLGILLGLIF